MTRQTNRLTDRFVKSEKKVDFYPDGGNLHLSVRKTRAGGLSKCWVFRYKIAGKQHDIGLGSASKVTLAKARAKAAEYRSLLDDGIDALAAKRAAKQAAKSATEAEKAKAARKTFGQCADDLFKSKRSSWRSEKGARQWIGSLKEYCKPVWDTPVEDIDTADHVLKVLQPIWQWIPETAKRVSERMAAVLDAAKAQGLRSAENPARWRGHLEMILPRRSKLAKIHHPALPYRDVAEFIGKLRESPAIHAACLEFCILTATRSNEALGAMWSEFDMDAKLWTIPRDRMKAGIEHRVPLSRRAIEIVMKQAAIRSSAYVFPGRKTGQALSPSSLRLLRPPGATIHGFRSAFRDWCGNETSFPREIAEQALAHTTGGAVEQAYRRGDALEKRRALMQAWASFCERGRNVFQIRAAT
jgi:integrase